MSVVWRTEVLSHGVWVVIKFYCKGSGAQVIGKYGILRLMGLDWYSFKPKQNKYHRIICKLINLTGDLSNYSD